MICPLCGSTSELQIERLPGYRASETYSTYYCSECDVCFVAPMSAEGAVYDLIYSHPGEVPGYDRYLRYQAELKYKKNPLDYLAEQEESYFACREVINSTLRRKGVPKILEVGCGLGYFTFACAKQGIPAIGYDSSIEAISSARRVYGNHYEHMEWIDFLKKYSNAADLVIVNQVIEHVPDAKLFMKELKSLLKDDGQIVLTTPMKPRGVANEWQTDLPPVHFWWFSTKSFKVLASLNDFDMQEIDFTKFYVDQYRIKTEISGVHPPSVFSEDGKLIAPVRPERYAFIKHILFALPGGEAFRSLWHRLNKRMRLRGSTGPVLAAVFQMPAKSAE